MREAATLLRVGLETVPCEVRLSARRRTFAIEVRPDPRVIVRAPARCPAWLVEARLAERSQWIARQLARLREWRRDRPDPPRYFDGEKHFLLGEPHRLEVAAQRRPRVEVLDGALRVLVPAGSGPERIRRVLETFYREQARLVFGAILLEQFEAWRALGHRCPPTLSIRKMKTRWGTLVDRRRMTLNLSLIHADRECIEYVVIHELCHLVYRGHGPRFHGLMDRRLPDWRDRKRRLESLGLA